MILEKRIKNQDVVANSMKLSFPIKKRIFGCIHNNVILFSLLFSLISFLSFSQENLSTLKGKELHNKVRLNFIPVEMPSDDFPNLKSTMGLLGIHYQIPINDWLYGGVAFHAALTGDQGGLFTLGAELGINKQLYKNLYLDANLHFGGGGGYRNLVNDGAFINPNIGLQYKKNEYSFGIQYSHLNFYTGEIKSNSVSFFVEIPSVLRFADYNKAHKKFVATNTSNDNFWKKPATKNVQQVRFDFFFPIGNSRKDNANNQEPITETLYVLGFEYQKYLNEKTFLFAHTDAIYKGLRAGFMDLFIGAGYHPYQSKNIDFFAKLAVGAAGGRVAPEGGLMAYPSAGFDLKFSNHFALSGHGGYYRALDGDLEAYTVGFGLKYFGLSGGTITSSKENNTHFYTQGIRIALQNQTYFDVQKTDSPNADLQLLALQVNYDITKTFYIIGEAGFAYGGKSGGYAQGLVGLGLNSPRFLNQKMKAYVEGVAGAGGGAGVDTGQGIIVRPAVGLRYNFSNAIALNASAGKMISPFGNLSSTNINIGLSFGLSTLNAKK